MDNEASATKYLLMESVGIDQLQKMCRLSDCRFEHRVLQLLQAADASTAASCWCNASFPKNGLVGSRAKPPSLLSEAFTVPGRASSVSSERHAVYCSRET